MGKFDRGEDHFFGFFLGAGLDHYDSVFVPNDHDVDGGGCALRIGGVDDKLTIHAANPHCAHCGAEGNVGESQSCRGCINADHIGVVFLVGREDQCDYLGLVAETIRKQRTNGAINLAAGEHFLFARPAFALNESAGNAATGVGVLAVIHGKGEEVDSFSGIGRSHGGGQDDGFTSGHQCGARGLLGHAAGLKDQTLAAGKLDSYFMLGRHRFLFSFCSLEKLVWGTRRQLWKYWRWIWRPKGHAQRSAQRAGE